MKSFLARQLIELCMASVLGLLLLAYVTLANLNVPADTLWAMWFVMYMLADADRLLY